MGLKEYQVVIAKSARSDLKQIDEYLKKRASREVAKKVRNGLLDLAMTLKHSPGRFSRERYLDDLERDIRSVSKSKKNSGPCLETEICPRTNLLVALRLQRKQFRVQPLVGQQLIMATNFHHFPAL